MGKAIGRREVLKAGLAGAAFGALGGLGTAGAQSSQDNPPPPGQRLPDGLHVTGPELALPAGFTYKTFGAFGSAMSDGFPTPPIPDGMGVFQDGAKIRIVRNHELGEGNDIMRRSVSGRPATAYDTSAPGCTTTMILDADANLLKSFISLNGTDTNCAGASTPWGTWLSCEETTIGTKTGRDRPHGYMFEVDPMEDSSVPTEPLRAMGRFLHEAAAVDQDTGVVYMTEDDNPDGFYRFVPETFGKLHKGGTLQMLKIRGQPGYNTVRHQTVGDALPVVWVTIDNPDPAIAESEPWAVFKQGRDKGAARFLSGEGATMRGNSVVFDSSDGGELGLGQIWEYTPTKHIGGVGEEGKLELLYESTDRQILDGPDNLCTSPNGQIVIAEDGKESASYVRALKKNGTVINLAKNLVPMRLSIIDASGKLYDPSIPDDGFTVGDGLGYSEFAGPRFSPDGEWLFVNIQVPGITCAITGDWGSLGL